MSPARLFRRPRTPALIAGGALGVLVLGIGATVALAGIPSSSGTYTGCYGNETYSKSLATPVRVLDTRIGLGGVTGPVPGGHTITVSVASLVPGASAVTGWLTVSRPSTYGFLTAWAGGPRPYTSALNYSPDRDYTSGVHISLSAAGTFDIYTLSTTQIVFDVTGGVYPATNVLRLIDPSAGQSCGPGETEVTWNQVGPTGPAGPQGLAGPQGPTGPSGPPGPAGAATPEPGVFTAAPTPDPSPTTATQTVASETITLQQAGLLLSTGTVVLEPPPSFEALPGTDSCQLFVDGTPVGNPSVTDQIPFGPLTIAVTGGAPEAAGTYTVTLTCSVPGTETLGPFTDPNLMAWETGPSASAGASLGSFVDHG